jgi:hypothetical protein
MKGEEEFGLQSSSLSLSSRLVEVMRAEIMNDVSRDCQFNDDFVSLK